MRPTKILHRIRLSISNAWFIPDPVPILIDSGVPGDLSRLKKALFRAGIEPESLQWILHTHGHSDHCGCTGELVRISGARTAIHRDELDRVRNGHHGEIHARDWMARTMHRFINPEFPSIEVDRVFDANDDGGSLDEFGLDGSVLHTPGHTGGSVSFVFADGDAVIGDLFRGSAWKPNSPRPAFFYDDADIIRGSIEKLLKTHARRFLPGHFGAMDRPAVERWFSPA